MKKRVLTTFEIDGSKDDARLIKGIELVGVREIARRTNISPSMLSRWMRGKTPMIEEKVLSVQYQVHCELRI